MELVNIAAQAPPVNVYEGNGQLSIALPIPGAHPDQTSVRVRPDQVVISAENKYPQDEQHYHRHDWRVGHWHVELDLPRRVDPAQARATLNYGVLVVMAPISDQGSGESAPKVS